MTPPSLEPPPRALPPGSPEPSASPQTASPRPHWLYRGVRGLGWAVLFGGTALAAAAGGALLALSVSLPDWLHRQAPEPLNLAELWQSGFRYRVTRPVNILVMGVDLPAPGTPDTPETRFAGRTDTMLLVRVDPDAQSVNLLSIPRDTQVNIPGEGIAKINHANVAGGPELVARTLQRNIGPAPIDRYIRVSTGALRELVDLLGGVEVMVPQRMVYRDETQGLTINLEPGWQTLDGAEAEQFARFRADGQGDIGRVQRQQMLLKALRDRLTHPTVIPRLPQMIRVMLRYVDTNLSVEEALALVNFALEIDSRDLQMVMLPGRPSTADEYLASYWILDPVATQEVMSEFFQLESVALLSDAETQAVTGLPIAIQNASGEPDVAREVARYLRREGFTNVYTVPDWSGQLQRTQVIAQRGDLESARILTSLLGLGRVVADSTGDLQSELTIRVGRDWTLLPPKTR